MSTKSQLAPVNRPGSEQLPSGLKSMTGYGEARLSDSGFNLRVAIRSVNHRFLDLHLRMPEGFESIEPRIRKVVRQRLRRGHLDVTVRHDLAGSSAVSVNQAVRYINATGPGRDPASAWSDRPDRRAVG